MSGDQLLVAAGILVTLALAGMAAMWKLATMLAEVRTTVKGELNHNGGGSTKDYARNAASDAEAARVAAEYANARIDSMSEAQYAARRKAEEDAAVRDAKLARVSHDLRDVRTAVALLAERVDRLDRRTTAALTQGDAT